MKNIVYGEGVHVGEGFAGVADFLEVLVDFKFGVAVPGQEATNFTCKKMMMSCICSCRNNK